MSNDRQYYENPLVTRYSSSEMLSIFGDQSRFSTWRQLWIALAKSEKELGLEISDQQIQEMEDAKDDIDFQAAAKYEKMLRHDVMAHVSAFGDVAPNAKPIIHLGATSCFITDNTDNLLMKKALKLVADRLSCVIDALASFAEKYRDLPCLGFTHFQPAQPTTVGKRACLWIYDLILDLQEVEYRLETLRCRSVKGTTGTQASFLKLFGGDHQKVQRLEQLVAEKLGFQKSYAVSGQTYTRKVDSQILDTLSGVAQSIHKFGSDLRLLSNRKELEEPFEANQIGSSAMPYKRNPMRSERMCSLARYVMALPSTSSGTVATQWLERTLDDSAVRRITIPQAFLAVDAILVILQNVASGMVVYPKVVEKNLGAELPFMASENAMMEAVKLGGDRQELHEKIRLHSIEAGKLVKQQGLENDLMDRLKADPDFAGVDLDGILDASQFVGRAPEQVDEFLDQEVAPIRSRYSDQIQSTIQEELKV